MYSVGLEKLISSVSNQRRVKLIWLAKRKTCFYRHSVLQRDYAYYIVGKARWTHLSTSHPHIKPEPLGEGLMWWRVLRSRSKYSIHIIFYRVELIYDLGLYFGMIMEMSQSTLDIYSLSFTKIMSVKLVTYSLFPFSYSIFLSKSRGSSKLRYRCLAPNRPRSFPPWPWPWLWRSYRKKRGQQSKIN